MKSTLLEGVYYRVINRCIDLCSAGVLLPVSCPPWRHELPHVQAKPGGGSVHDSTVLRQQYVAMVLVPRHPKPYRLLRAALCPKQGQG